MLQSSWVSHRRLVQLRTSRKHMCTLDLRRLQAQEITPLRITLNGNFRDLSSSNLRSAWPASLLLVEKVVSGNFEGRARSRGAHITNIIPKGEKSGAERPKFPYDLKWAQRLSDPEFIRINTYAGDAIHLERNSIDIRYQHPYTGLGPCCEDLHNSNKRTPLTCTTRVSAKISIEGDTHLSKEAKNYQSLPDHFFEHRRNTPWMIGSGWPILGDRSNSKYWKDWKTKYSSSGRLVMGTQWMCDMRMREESYVLGCCKVLH